MFKAVDPEGQPVSYTVASLPVKGILTNKKTGTAVKVSDSFKQSDIDSGLLLYKPNTNINGSDSVGVNRFRR